MNQADILVYNGTILAMDDQNNTIASTQTDRDGEYKISLIAPWDTDGENITIFCDLGIYSQNETIQQLEEFNTLNIEVENGPGFTLALLYITLVLNIMGFALVGYFIMNQKKKEPIVPNEPVYPNSDIIPDLRTE